MASLARQFGRLVVLVLLATEQLASASPAKGPVEELRAALEAMPADAQPERTKGAEADREAWEKRITAVEKTIVRLDDLCRAVLLMEWPSRDRERGRPDSPSEIAVRTREALGKRLVNSARAVLSRGDSSRRMAVLTLIGDSAKSEQEVLDSTMPGAIFPVLKADVIDLLKREKTALVRVAALRALPQLQATAAELAPFLKRGLDKSTQVAERRATAGVLQSFPALAWREIRPTPMRADGRDGGQRAKLNNESNAARLLSTWKEQSEPLLPFVGQGIKDNDPRVRQLCLAALASAIEGFDQYVEFVRVLAEDARNPFAGMARPDNVLAQFRGAWEACLLAINRELGEATASLKDDDLAVCLAAHKTIENCATLRLRLGDRSWFGPVNKQMKDPLDEPVKAVKALTGSLKHKQVRVRLAALYVLETLTADAVPAAARWPPR